MKFTFYLSRLDLLYGQKDNIPMVSGNNLKSFRDNYVAKDFDKSIDILEELKSKFEPGVFYYNLGTIKVKQGKLAEGRLYLEKAKVEGYSNDYVKNNISKTKELLGVVEMESPQTIGDHINFYTMNLDANIYLTFTLLFLVIGSFLYKKISKGFKAVLIILAIIPISFKLYFVDNLTKAVSLSDLDIYEGPSKVFEKTNILSKGLLVKLINKQEGWSYVIYPDKLQGWIKTEEIEVLEQ
jgi:hypothetical protein